MVIQSQYPSVDLPKTGLIQYLFSNSHNIPEHKEILIDVTTGQSLTYAQLKDNIFRFAAGLQDIVHFQKGDVLALFSPNQYDYPIPMLGAIAAGGATSPANPAYTAHELAYQLSETKAKVLVAHQTNIETALEAAKSVGLPPSHVFVFGGSVVKGIRPYSELLVQRLAVPVEYNYEEAKDTVAILCFSSGTTGRSKGVMTTHANLTANTMQYNAIEGPFMDAASDRTLGVLPFFHIFGLTVVLQFSIYWGTPVYVIPRFELPLLLETIQKQKITKACLVPPIILLLAKHPLIEKYDLSSLKVVTSGAAPLSADLANEVGVRLPHTVFRQGYGLTETSPVTLMEPSDRTIPGSTGLLVPNALAKLVDENGKEVSGQEQGELWVKGPHVMKGYINNLEATAGCIDEDGYFHTGDVARMDENGYFFIVDRIKELIKYKGFQVPPAELEALLLTSPMVADCAVIGVYDKSQATEIPRGYIVLKQGLERTEQAKAALQKFVEERVVHYKRLRSIVFIDEIPKSPSGKILRRVLRDASNNEQIKSKL
ncbi:hypothetical protein DFQ28_004589 [Apophysomyces sp. BC1034]|nr:hypothetical protein DFQ30_005908 [Apophysomyces sp. BC1015]KAG0178039.1 hypothetical protein DFQ29_004015 [Apophysomyces sp. BC1021]KAG0188625.1 hypothetical protein DFQ28_004589 [Apophysomyces sp. BC1034]